jgi:hypothetical protein
MIVNDDGSVSFKEVREYDGSEPAPFDAGGSTAGMDNFATFAPTQPPPVLIDVTPQVGGITVNAPKVPETPTAAPVVPSPAAAPAAKPSAAAAVTDDVRTTRTIVDTRLVYAGLIIVAIGIAIAIANSEGGS